jgi:thiamine-monophosphate kinase
MNQNLTVTSSDISIDCKVLLLKNSEPLGEKKIIRIIQEQLDLMSDLPLGFGDDVSAISIDENHLAVLKTDMLVGKTDVPPGMSLKQAARKAVVMNISDFAAKGVKPLVILASLGLPRGLKEEDVKEIGEGLNEGAREYGTYVIGGDTNESSDLIISCSLFGLCTKERLISRSGARPGDIVAVTGEFGKTAAGLKILVEGLPAPKKIEKPLKEAVLMPRARLREGIALSGTGGVTASIDSSDGLAWSLYELSDASDVGFAIDDLPIAKEALEFARMHRLDPCELALYGGEEYELVVTVKPEFWEAAVREAGGSLLKIGVVTREMRIELHRNGETRPIERRGWEHFKM